MFWDMPILKTRNTYKRIRRQVEEEEWEYLQTNYVKKVHRYKSIRKKS